MSASGVDAAVAAAQKYPRPLPLPPGVSLEQLASRLKKTAEPISPASSGIVSQRVSKLEDATPPSSVASPISPTSSSWSPPKRWEAPALPEYGGGSQDAEREPEPVPSVTEEASEPEPSPAIEASAGLTGGLRSLDLARGVVMHVAPDLQSLDAHEACEEDYLWLTRCDQDIAEAIDLTLNDFDLLSAECDALFQVSCSQKLIRPVPDLAIVTQALVDKLGCRSPPRREHIGHIFTAAASANNGLNNLEFQGYVASVLAQILQELRDRCGVDEQPLEEACADGLPETPTVLSPRMMGA